VTTSDELVTGSESETTAVGERVAADLIAGDVVLLYGALGAGKTAFVRGLARGLGAPGGDVSSPTFTIIQEYAGGRLLLQHVDLYRLSPVEATDLGLDELISGNAVVAIEWPDRWRDRPADALEVRIDHTSDTSRRIKVTRHHPETQNR
jgi:tRNA threonylcarbamoyladenosine biosynthesis protein TsaE